MTATNAAMTATQDWVPLAASLAAGFYTIGSENIRVREEPHETGRDRTRARDGQFVDRGVGGSTAASHATNSTLTRYYPDAVGSGAANPAGFVELTTATPEAIATALIDAGLMDPA